MIVNNRNIIAQTFEGFNVHAVMMGGDPWFIAKDVAKALGYKDTDQAIRKHCRKVKNCPVESTGQVRHVQVIPESDVYRLIMRSRLKSAERFEDWVTEKVLPSIRKNGAFINGVSDNKNVSSELRDKLTRELVGKGKALLSDIDRHALYGSMKPQEIINLSEALSKRHGVPASLVEAMIVNGMAAMEDI
ncbi:hypothetical protein DVP71_09770 [Yersinia enterocolitica]|nr:hypothetical protein [Yersinia enterocolitica]EKN5921236.1 hypothetical protein [Yersinia enterocolitica]QKJ17655.1 hypothetical protein HRD70_00460 [Yersinia kristensenii]